MSRGNEDAYAVRFRTGNGTIHTTIVWADGAAALFEQVQDQGRAEILTYARVRTQDAGKSPAEVLAA